jgi:Holliday junction resolvasome RuvABC endonuclease subunit
MRIMGADLSITRTGLGLPDATTLAVVPPKQVTGDDRLEYLADHIGLAARTAGVELVVIEGLGGVYKGEAARTMPMVHGAVRLELKRHRIPYMLLSPSSLKKFATGNGAADKTAMALAALKRLGREYATNDECDADWLRVAGRFAYGLPEVTDTPGPSLAVDRVLRMPVEQVKALRWSIGKKEEIVWPVVGGRVPWPGLALRA